VRFREKRESQLRIQAETDPLTGMFNRRRFAIELEMLFIRARKEQTPLSMIMLDADYFKKINDAFGHVAGDKVLCDLAHLCQQVIRDSDVVCRFGGEEFAFLLPDSDLSEAIPIAERLITAVRNNAVVWQGQSIRYQVSIGVAELSADDAEAMHLLHRTDTQLYRAKTNGRNQICY
jgi:diguanylate cyclase (GGDEF)-like protein